MLREIGQNSMLRVLVFGFDLRSSHQKDRQLAVDFGPLIQISYFQPLVEFGQRKIVLAREDWPVEVVGALRKGL